MEILGGNWEAVRDERQSPGREGGNAPPPFRGRLDEAGAFSLCPGGVLKRTRTVALCAWNSLSAALKPCASLSVLHGVPQLQ